MQLFAGLAMLSSWALRPRSGRCCQSDSRRWTTLRCKPSDSITGLPHEQRPNPYVTRELSFEFHYFFMRKLWFAHLARALIAFPGGFGTLDELTEILTLSQTRKLDRKITILLYGSSYWNEIVNFDALVRHGMIAREDLGLFQFVDDPATALRILQDALALEPEVRTPAFARSATPRTQPG